MTIWTSTVEGAREAERARNANANNTQAPTTEAPPSRFPQFTAPPSARLIVVADPYGQIVRETYALQFPYRPVIINRLKRIGFWWNVTERYWYAPLTRTSSRAIRLSMAKEAIQFLRQEGYTIIGEQQLTEQRAAATPNPFAVAAEAARASAARMGVVPDPDPALRRAEADLNRLVQQRVAAQRAQQTTQEAPARERAVIRPQGRGQRNPAVDPFYSVAGFVIRGGSQGTLLIEREGQKVAIDVEQFQRWALEQSCPLENPFALELHDLYQKLRAQEAAIALREQSYAQLARGEISSKEVYLRFPTWQHVSDAGVDALREEFEVMARALKEVAPRALAHQGCKACRTKK